MTLKSDREHDAGRLPPNQVLAAFLVASFAAPRFSAIFVGVSVFARPFDAVSVDHRSVCFVLNPTKRAQTTRPRGSRTRVLAAARILGNRFDANFHDQQKTPAADGLLSSTLFSPTATTVV